ncbi:DUF5131 family protein [bacterium]|nr:DUF5131 family protein [bacterium]
MLQHTSSGNMYPWVGVTRNFIGGECPHECVYCYVPSLGRRFSHIKMRYSGEPFLIEKELSRNEGSGKMVFVQSCGDLCAKKIPSEWIWKVLNHCKAYPDNTYLIQSKNPERYLEFIHNFPIHSILGTTIETNRQYHLSKAPEIDERVRYIKMMKDKGFDVMVSIEPVLDFDMEEFVQILRNISPNFISIGADSKGHGLPEPIRKKVKTLVEELQKLTEVRLKSNLDRLMLMSNE